MDKQFEDFLIARNDELDNAAYQFMRLMLSLPDEEQDNNDPFPWDMEHIGELEDIVEQMLQEHGLLCCHPYYESKVGEEMPCYRGKDCKRAVCPFRRAYITNEGEEK